MSDTDTVTYTYFLVKILHSSETQVCRWAGEIEKDTHVIVNSRYGKDLARVLGPVRRMMDQDTSGIESIVRLAVEHDLQRYEDNIRKEQEAFLICREKIKSHKLEMKLISAHYVLEESKVLFFFTAEARVDFRELVKDLVSVFKMRIELRQVGVRDESRVLGGLAVCGRTYCCHGVTDKLKPVSIKMAMKQSLSLNSMKISGPCGRLLCCLSYEYDLYKEEKAKFPAEGSKIFHEKERFKVVGVNILTKRISVVSGDGRYLDIPSDMMEKELSGSWNIKKEFFQDEED